MCTPVSYSHAIENGGQIEHFDQQLTGLKNDPYVNSPEANQRVTSIFLTSCCVRLAPDNYEVDSSQSKLHSNTFLLRDISNRTQYFQDLILLLANDTNWKKHPRCSLLNIPIVTFTFSQLFPGHDQNYSMLIKSFELFFGAVLGFKKLASLSIDADTIPILLSVAYLAELFGEPSIGEAADKQLSCKGIKPTSVGEAIELARCAKQLKLSKLLSQASSQYLQMSINRFQKDIVSYQGVIEKYYPVNGMFLTELNLSSFEWLTNPLLAKILQSTVNLKTLVTGKAKLTYEEVKLPQALEELNISENRTIQEINLFALFYPGTQIKKLHLNNTNLHLKEGILPEGIQQLHISDTPITTKSLSSALKASKNLVILDISGCNIDLSEITQDDLPCLQNLLHLECRFNQKLDNPCRVANLRNFFSSAQSIKLLDLSNSNATLEGISFSRTLKELFIYGCKNIRKQFLDDATMNCPEIIIEK